MKSTFLWLLLAGAVFVFGDVADAWNRQVFGRYSRNLFRNGDAGGAAAAANPLGNNELDSFNALFGLNNNLAVRGASTGDVDVIGQQAEVYGIVEPLIEDMPCVDRPCTNNEECCPTGVCVNTYGEGKCIYVYGRKRDLCRHNSDCELGTACVKGPAGNMMCQGMPPVPVMHASGINAATLNAALQVKQFGEECATSSDCNVTKGMCCQFQRNHHRMMPKKMCAYFRDPFTCIDIMPTEDEEIRESRILSSYRQRRM